MKESDLMKEQLIKSVMRENELLKQKLQIYKIFSEEAESSVFIIDLNGRILEANSSAEKMYGFSSNEFSLMTVFDLRKGDSKEIIENQITIASMDGIAFKTNHVRKDGSSIYVDVSSKGILLGENRVLISVIKDITNQKKAEAELRDRELKYNTLFDTAEGAILLFTDGRWVDCNVKALKIFGCDREQIIGQNPIVFSPPTQPNGSNSVTEAKHLIDLAYSNGPQFFEWVHCRADGTLFDAEVSLKRLDIDGKSFIQAIVLDVSEQKSAKMKLIQSTTLNEAIVESTSDLIWSVDPFTFGLLSFNTALIEHFNKMKVNISVGMRPEDLVSDNDFRDTWHQFYKRALLEERYSIEYLTNNGSTSLLLTFGLLKYDNKVFGISVFGKDVTKEKNYKLQLEKANKILEVRVQQSINTISKIGEMRDVYTAGHQKRVSELACAIAKEMGLSDELIYNVKLGALIHDIGKIYIGSDILNKPGKISNLEYQILQTLERFYYLHYQDKRLSKYKSLCRSFL